MRKAAWLRGKKKRKSPSEPFNERSGRNLRVRRKVCMVEGIYIMVPEKGKVGRYSR